MRIPLFTTLVGSILGCSINEVRIKVGDNAAETFKFPSKLPIRRVLGKDAIKYSLSLSGDCHLVQSNFIFTRTDKDEYGYFPLLCGRDVNEPCRVTLTAEDALLKAAEYNVKLMLASHRTGKEPEVFEWEMGILDFEEAIIGTVEKGTADQLEDVFEKTMSENRPPFSSSVAKSDNGFFASTIFSLVVILPWIYLLFAWYRLGILTMPFKKIWAFTGNQKLFFVFFMSWLGLALANWSVLDTFKTLKLGSALFIPTLIFGLRGLREAVDTRTESGEKKQN